MTVKRESDNEHRDAKRVKVEDSNGQVKLESNPYLSHWNDDADVKGNGNGEDGFAGFKRHATTSKQTMAAEDGPNNPFTGRPLSSKYMSILKTRRGLPVHQQRDEFLKLYQESQILVFVGETGSGKTTQIPQFVLYDDLPQRTGQGASQRRLTEHRPQRDVHRAHDEDTEEHAEDTVAWRGERDRRGLRLHQRQRQHDGQRAQVFVGAGLAQKERRERQHDHQRGRQQRNRQGAPGLHAGLTPRLAGMQAAAIFG